MTVYRLYIYDEPFWIKKCGFGGWEVVFGLSIKEIRKKTRKSGDFFADMRNSRKFAGEKENHIKTTIDYDKERVCRQNG